MDPLRIGVLGTARISTTALLGPAASVPEVTVAAVAARNRSRAAAYAREHQIPVAYDGYHALLADPDIDAVYNPLPNSLHGPWTLTAIAAGKHVLCEKPFASNAAEAARVADAAAASGLVVMEAMHYRYHPLIRRLSELTGELGPVRHIQCWTSFVISDPGDIRYDYALGGGALMDGGCYAIDCLRLLGPGEPSVTAALADPLSLVSRAFFGGGGGPGDGGAAGLSGRGDGLVRVGVHPGRGVPGRRPRELRARDRVGAGLHPGALGPPGRGQERVGAGRRAGRRGHDLHRAAARVRGGLIVSGAAVPTSAAHAVTTMRLIDDAYRAAGLLPRGV